MVKENGEGSFRPVTVISQQQITALEERIVELERRVDEMANHQGTSTPTKPITQKDIVNVLDVSISLLGTACFVLAVVFWIDIFLLSSSPNTGGADFDLSLILFFSGIPLILFGWFKGFSKMVTFNSEEN